MRWTVISNAKFPYCNNVSCRRDVFGGVAADKEQIGTEAWSDASAVIQMKYGRWHRSSGGKRIRRREASTDQELALTATARRHFALFADDSNYRLIRHAPCRRTFMF